MHRSSWVDLMRTLQEQLVLTEEEWDFVRMNAAKADGGQ